MTDHPPPQRLKLDDELGPLLRAADEPAVSPERLAANAERVRIVIAAGARSSRWKWLAGLLAAGGVGVVAMMMLREDAPARVPASVAFAVIDAGVTDAAAAPLTLPTPVDAMVDASVMDASVPSPRPPVRRPERPATPPGDAGVDAPPVATSDLPEQIRLYEAARAASRRGDPAAAIALVDELISRYPSTPLASEAALERAEALARARRLPEAAAALTLLVADPAHRGRRGELLRTLGDVYRLQGDCTRATDAYTRAAAERLGASQRRDVEHGLAQCTKKS